MNFFFGQVEQLKRKLEEVCLMEEKRGPNTTPMEASGNEWATKVRPGNPVEDNIKVEDIEEDVVNGHVCPLEMNGLHSSKNLISDKISLQNGIEDPPVHEVQMSSSSCSAASPTFGCSSPCTSPVLSKRAPGSQIPGSYQSPLQAGINQRFHAARHKFQGTTDPEQQSQAVQSALPSSPKELSPVTSTSSTEASPVKQMARSTVTQVLSRFTTVQQSATAKLTSPNNSPFGTDYRNLAAPLSPVIGRATGAILQGIRSPTIARADRGNPPPIPPKKPGLAQAPPSPAPVPKSASHFSDSPLSGSCGLTSSQEGVKELDMVVSSN